MAIARNWKPDPTPPPPGGQHQRGPPSASANGMICPNPIDTPICLLRLGEICKPQNVNVTHAPKNGAMSYLLLEISSPLEFSMRSSPLVSTPTRASILTCELAVY